MSSYILHRRWQKNAYSKCLFFLNISNLKTQITCNTQEVYTLGFHTIQYEWLWNSNNLEFDYTSESHIIQSDLAALNLYVKNFTQKLGYLQIMITWLL